MTTVADARALSAGQYEAIIVFGDTAIGDGGGGIYVWNAGASNADDGGEWIKPTSVSSGSPGRWNRITRNIDIALGTMATQSAASVAITGGSITGITDLAIADGGTGASTAATAFANLKQAATTTATGVVELATDGENAAGVVVQGNDSRLHSPVTLVGVPDYLTLSGQQITRAAVNLATHVTGTLPAANAPLRTPVTESGTSRTNTAADNGNWVDWSSAAAKTFTIAANVASAGHVWVGMNIAATGKLSFVAGSGFTLTGNLVFDPLKAYMLYFTSATAGDLIGGTAT